MHTGYEYIPNIYFGEEHMGGLDDLKAFLMDRTATNRIIDQNGIVLSATTDDETAVSSQEESEYRFSEKYAL
jgi:hypothetical protein